MRSDVCIQVFILLNEKAEGPTQLWHCISIPHLHTYILTAKTEKACNFNSHFGTSQRGKKKRKKKKSVDIFKSAFL